MTRVAVRTLVHLVSVAAGLLVAAWLLGGDLTVTSAHLLVTVALLTVVLAVLEPALGSLVLRLARGGRAGRSRAAVPSGPGRPEPARAGAPRAPVGERHGPVEFVALAFAGQAPPAAVTAELGRLAADRRLGIVDVVVVRRRAPDELEVLPVEDLRTVADVPGLAVSSPGTVRGDDVVAMARGLAPGTSAVLVVYERRTHALVAATRDLEAAALAHHLVPFVLTPGQLDRPSATS